MQVVQGLYRSIINEGWLIVSSSELSQHLFSQFDSVNFPGAIVYRKEYPGYSKQNVFYFDEKFSQQEIIPSINESVTEEEHVLQYQFLNDKKLQAIVSPAIPNNVHAGVLNKYQEENDAEDIDKSDTYAARHNIMRMIRELADSGKLSEALALCNNAISADKLDPGLHYIKAIILQEDNRYNEAITSLKQTLYLDPNHALAHFTLGNISLRCGDMKSAKKAFNNALDLVSACMQEEILPESSGITAGRFREIIQATIKMGVML
jgi:chemotaxis protein methyltransferase CheR